MTWRGRLAVGLLLGLRLAADPGTAAAEGGSASASHGPTLAPLSAGVALSGPGGAEEADALGELAYNRHFERRGTPPPFDFLEPLISAPPTTARLERGVLRFPGSGVRVVLAPPVLPVGGVAIPPALLSTADGRWVLARFSLYVPPGRTIQHRVEVFSGAGDRAGAFDSLPTHALRGHDDLLVAPERVVESTGYCESLRWSLRFYDLRRGAVREYGCPEGRCGDLLFTRLGESGPLLLALEEVEVADGAATVVTRLFLLGADGQPGAADWIRQPVGAVSEGGSCAAADQLARRSPFAVANLISVRPVPGATAWLFRFDRGAEAHAWRLEAAPSQATVPALPAGPPARRP